jgi:hypothetical protein
MVMLSKKPSKEGHLIYLENYLSNTVGAIKNKQSRETGQIGYAKRRQTKQKYNTICVGDHYMQTNTNNTNKT